MPYQYAIDHLNYADFSSGRVFYSLPGYPAFPVRLACEMFQRLLNYRSDIQDFPIRLFDPCCGGAYHLAVLGFMFWQTIGSIIASDVDPMALALARQNLGLLEPEGLNTRTMEIESLYKLYGKISHAEALQSADRLSKIMENGMASHPISTCIFQADALDANSLKAGFSTAMLSEQSIDLVFSDIPYGKHSNWQVSGTTEANSPVFCLLESLHSILKPTTLFSKSAEKYKVTVLPDCSTTVDEMLHNIALHGLSTRVSLLQAKDAI